MNPCVLNAARVVNFRCWVSTMRLFSPLVLLAWLQVTLARSFGLQSSSNDLLVNTTSGLIKGFLDTNTTSVALNKWLGVPYADDTSGKNRWRPPQPVKVKAGQIINATAYGPACMQGR